jgi:uncharacterized protein
LPATVIREFIENSVEPHVRGFLHVPETPNGNGLVLTHGAGSNAQSPLLIALAETFSAAGFTVLRCNLPYRQTRSFGPPGPGDATRDRAGLKNAIASLKNLDFGVKNQSAGRIFLGGHSYGGRQSSMLCAELSAKEHEAAPPNAVSVGWESIAGLLLLSYPLHPPRKPEQQRTQHLPNLHTPTLFVHGTRDPFGTIAELEQALKMIPAKTKLLPVEGAGHDLGFKGKTKKEELPNRISAEFISFFKLSS